MFRMKAVLDICWQRLVYMYDKTKTVLVEYYQVFAQQYIHSRLAVIALFHWIDFDPFELVVSVFF